MLIGTRAVMGVGADRLYLAGFTKEHAADTIAFLTELLGGPAHLVG